MGILKIIGAFIGSFIVMLAAVFFLYPYLNAERYEEIVMPRDEDGRIVGTTSRYNREEFMALNQELERLQDHNAQLRGVVDSLTVLTAGINPQVLDSLIDAAIAARGLVDPDTLPEPDAGATLAANIPGSPAEPPPVDDAAIRTQVNSLLNLDEEEMAPIVRELSNEQLKTLYRVASNQQREKLLRSLPANRAARLMQEVLL
ncbi:MAG: hypothetical protein JJU41_09905 [Bacteroidetes bacterium]|nr:hypothetical protein [Bacteroidota bacterium]MCH8523830.1 hypothetical protein [Balneolales bacterium]